MNRSIPDILFERLQAAAATAFGPDVALDRAWLRSTNDPKFGDYQFNGALPLAKQLGAKPRELADKLKDALALDDLCAPPEVAGPGFLNLRLSTDFLNRYLQEVPPADPASEYDRLGVAPATQPDKVVVDMSSPNLAKEMHVGHLRSTVIGESVARILEFAGHDVERVNHVGDWGTQFGMLLAHLRATQPQALGDLDHLAISDLEGFYREAKQHFDSDAAFADEARRTVVQLQGGDPETLRIWRAFCAESLRHCHAVYAALDITRLVDRGESFYNAQLADVVDELSQKGLVEKSEGADCVFVEGFKTREGEPLPFLVRKSDGGFLYATTDLAAARFRIRDCGATRVIYVVGLPQKQHFEMLFAVLRKAGWAHEGVQLEHLGFGSMLDASGAPFKTRAGGTVKLKNLLDEAVDRARIVVEAGNDDPESVRGQLSAADRAHIAETVGIAAVKYFDLSHNLSTDYRFDWDHMLALDGNTAPYMLYAYARIRSIARKAGVDFASLPADAPITLEHESEIALAKAVARFPEIVASLVRDLRPSLLTEYLFELSRSFSRFYDRKLGVRVIDAEPESLRISRLRLCDLTARVIHTGLQLLGIPTIEKM
ncbi:MAG TPA: arginine--tRNA ligase [Phycisphaerae bacterium]|nr:arginine--tRNA ligase [Phycisphaerales bacterium]HRX84603.1 arginine--tRNA ligase [Phycisphaerae bacterium]